VGVIEPNFMFEGTTSSAWLTFLERPEIDNIAADTYGAGDSRRGVEMNWQKTDTLWAGDNINMTVAYTGAKTGSNAGHGNGGDEQSQLLGRFSDRLWTDGISNLQIGASASDILYSGGGTNGAGTIRLRDRPEIRVDGTRLIDTGSFTAKHGYMYAFDVGMNYENFFLGGEYAHFDVDKSHSVHPNFDGWYVEGSWFITGETRQYSASALNNEVGGWQGPSAIASPFSLDGDSWGALELAARYSDTDLNWHLFDKTNGVAGGRENVVDIALNWYLNKNVRLMIDDLIVHLNKQSAAGGTPGQILTQPVSNGANPGTPATFIRPQSQDINIVGVRLQFAN
jgi:phosphate-selective porin OprO/OprP